MRPDRGGRGRAPARRGGRALRARLARGHHGDLVAATLRYVALGLPADVAEKELADIMARAADFAVAALDGGDSDGRITGTGKILGEIRRGIGGAVRAMGDREREKIDEGAMIVNIHAKAVEKLSGESLPLGEAVEWQKKRERAGVTKWEA